MRVLVFSEGFGARTLTFVYNEVIALNQHAEVHVVCTEKGDAELLQYDHVTEIPWRPNKLIRRIKWELWKKDILLDESNPEFAVRLRKLIASYRPDVIHCHFGIEALKLTDNFKDVSIPVVVTFHGYDATQFDHKESYKKKLRSTFGRPNIFPMFVSDYIKRRVANLGVPVEKGYLLYLGINLDRFKRTSFPNKENGIRFTQISSFAGQKGHSYSVVAIRKFIDKHPDLKVKFTFGGGGGVEKDEIIKLVKHHNLEGVISFTDKLNPEQVRQLLEDTHIFYHPSVVGPKGETEGLPTAIMEAMAMELPVFSTFHAGIPELVQNGINGLLVQEKDTDEYVRKMEEIIHWNYLPVNRQRVMEMCEMNAHALQLMEIYKSVIEKCKSHGAN